MVSAGFVSHSPIHLKGPVCTLMPSALDRTDANRCSALVGEHSAAAGVWTGTEVLPTGWEAAASSVRGGQAADADVAVCGCVGCPSCILGCGGRKEAESEGSEDGRRRHME